MAPVSPELSVKVCKEMKVLVCPIVNHICNEVLPYSVQNPSQGPALKYEETFDFLLIPRSVLCVCFVKIQDTSHKYLFPKEILPNM